MPPDARLGGAPALQEIRQPSPPVDLVPRPVVQRSAFRGWPERLRGQLAPATGGALILAGFGAAFFYLLSFRDAEIRVPVEVPVDVEIRVEPSKGERSAAAERAPEPPQAEALRQALSPPVAPAPGPPAPPRVQPLPQPPAPPQPPPATAGPRPPDFVAPPPEPARAAASEHADKPANLAPDADREDAGQRDARAPETPQALTTGDATASFAVPPPAPPKRAEKPARPAPAKEPSAPDRLAAALAMDPAAMPTTFRSVLAGNGAQVDAAYKGLVFGRFNRHPEIGERARLQGLRGQMVVAFTIDDAGRIDGIGIARSSGNPALDALGLELVRAAAPFPPPPPGAQRSFTPALGFGD